MKLEQRGWLIIRRRKHGSWFGHHLIVRWTSRHPKLAKGERAIPVTLTLPEEALNDILARVGIDVPADQVLAEVKPGR